MEMNLNNQDQTMTKLQLTTLRKSFIYAFVATLIILCGMFVFSYLWSGGRTEIYLHTLKGCWSLIVVTFILFMADGYAIHSNKNIL